MGSLVFAKDTPTLTANSAHEMRFKHEFKRCKPVVLAQTLCGLAPGRGRIRDFEASYLSKGGRRWGPTTIKGWDCFWGEQGQKHAVRRPLTGLCILKDGDKSEEPLSPPFLRGAFWSEGGRSPNDGFAGSSLAVKPSTKSSTAY